MYLCQQGYLDISRCYGLKFGLEYADHTLARSDHLPKYVRTMALTWKLTFSKGMAASKDLVEMMYLFISSANEVI